MFCVESQDVYDSHAGILYEQLCLDQHEQVPRLVRSLQVAMKPASSFLRQ